MATYSGTFGIFNLSTGDDNFTCGNQPGAMLYIDGLGGFDTIVFTQDSSNIHSFFVDQTSGGIGLDQSSGVTTVSGASIQLSHIEKLTFGDGLWGLVDNTATNNLIGHSGEDIMYGLAGNDTLDGGAGADTMYGGAGNDTYIVGTGGAMDTVIEAASAGTDLVKSYITYTLTSNVEQLTLLGTTAIDGTGNTLANTLTGNAGANALSGGDGNDTLTGGAGADNLTGGNGSDTLIVNAVVGTSSDSARAVVTGINNDTGQDTLTGFDLSADTIKIVATSVTSFVHGTDTTIGAGTGTEVAGSRASFSTLTGLIELNQTTNDNWGDAGDIALTFATPSTTLTEANFEARLQYQLTGTAAANTLTGGKLADTLNGNAGNDTLNGRLGNDVLTGGTGADIFIFNTALNASTNRDTITDFNVTDDTIQLENTGTGLFTALATGALAAGAFQSGAGMTMATELDDRIIYNTTTGALYYDADGSGTASSAIQFATIGKTTHAALTYADFMVI